MGPGAKILLEEKATDGKLYAVCPIETYPGLAIQSVADSSRWEPFGCLLDPRECFEICGKIIDAAGPIQFSVCTKLSIFQYLFIICMHSVIVNINGRSILNISFSSGILWSKWWRGGRRHTWAWASQTGRTASTWTPPCTTTSRGSRWSGFALQ